MGDKNTVRTLENYSPVSDARMWWIYIKPQQSGNIHTKTNVRDLEVILQLYFLCVK